MYSHTAGGKTLRAEQFDQGPRELKQVLSLRSYTCSRSALGMSCGLNSSTERQYRRTSARSAIRTSNRQPAGVERTTRMSGEVTPTPGRPRTAHTVPRGEFLTQPNRPQGAVRFIMPCPSAPYLRPQPIAPAPDGTCSGLLGRADRPRSGTARCRHDRAARRSRFKRQATQRSTARSRRQTRRRRCTRATSASSRRRGGLPHRWLSSRR
jgi:hypothetical protein